MDKKIIIRNFSRYAHTYDLYADVQRRIALALLGMIRKKIVNKILEIGAGTGNYTLFLRETFPNSSIKAVDISKKMIDVASRKIQDKRTEFILADAEQVDFTESFDLITSNACFQWFEDLEEALIKYKKLLRENGFVLFSIFGPSTLWELNTSLGYLFRNISVSAGNFIAREKLENILNKNFGEVEIKEITFEESFFCLRDMLNKIKYTGTNGNGLSGKIFFTPHILRRLEKVYLNKFKQIKASYQVFFCRSVR